MSLKYISSLAALGVMVVAATPAMAESSLPNNANFECDSENGIPITISKANSRTIFRWETARLDSLGVDAAELCKNAALKLDEYVAKNYVAENNTDETANPSSILSLRADQQFGLPTICIADQAKDSCQTVLFTLPPTEKPVQTANDLLAEILVDEDLKSNKEEFSPTRGVQSNRYSISIFDLLFGTKYLK